MKKKWSLIAAAAAALALAGCMLAGCGSNDAAKDSANSDTTKLIVGFDQSYPPYGFVGNDGNYTSTSPPRSPIAMAGTSSSRLSIGTRKTRCSIPVLSTAFGMASPWRAAKTTTPSLIRTC